MGLRFLQPLLGLHASGASPSLKAPEGSCSPCAQRSPQELVPPLLFTFQKLNLPKNISFCPTMKCSGVRWTSSHVRVGIEGWCSAATPLPGEVGLEQGGSAETCLCWRLGGRSC